VSAVFFALGVFCAALLAVPLSYAYSRRTLRRFREMKKRALASERLAYVGTLAGGLAHEIKNPLSTVNINLQLMEEDWEGDDSPRGRMLLRKINLLQREVKRLEEILNDFLKFARGQDLEVHKCDLNQLVDDVLDFVSPEITAHGINVLKSYDERLPPCDLDADLIKQALLNVIKNARESMPEGGDLMIRTTRKDGSVEVSITDTGQGIPPESMEKIFRAYYSTKKGGTGLGLPTAKRIVEDHQGVMTVQSEVGKGTSFTISLPVDQPVGTTDGDDNG